MLRLHSLSIVFFLPVLVSCFLAFLHSFLSSSIHLYPKTFPFLGAAGPVLSSFPYSFPPPFSVSSPIHDCFVFFFSFPVPSTQYCQNPSLSIFLTLHLQISKLHSCPNFSSPYSVSFSWFSIGLGPLNPEFRISVASYFHSL